MGASEEATETTPLAPKDEEAGGISSTAPSGETTQSDAPQSDAPNKAKWDAQVADGAKKAAVATSEAARVAADATAKAAGKAFEGAKVGAAATATYTSKKAIEAKEWVMDGPVPFRVLAFGAGCAIMGASIRDMVEEIVFTDPFQTISSMFNLVFGIIMVLLESTAVFKRTPWRQNLYENASFLRTTFGRGVFYLYLGINMCSQHFSNFSFIVGLVTLGIGAIAVIVGYWTQRKITKLREALRDEDMVKQSFEEHDKENHGYLNPEEFAELSESLGVPMKKTELLAVFDVIDTSSVAQKKNTITLDEFLTWWKEWDELAEVV